MKSLPSTTSFPKLEEEVLEYWDEESIFQKSLEKNKGKKPYIFYDGPPFATGLPHYGHILTSYIKDTIPRYFTMRGFFVDRRWGWDCHGLPVEYEVEKMLKISGKKDIESIGIDKFNDTCKSIVLKYASEWETIVHRIGRWVDFQRQYRTMDLSFMESIMWVFSELYKRGLIYQSLRVVPYCNRCQTALSNFETGLDDSFREREDPAVTVRFRVPGEENTSFLAWTTTPWTLPSNLALAVNRELEYSLLKLASGESVWIATACTKKYEKLLAHSEVEKTVKGEALVGLKYLPPFDFADAPNAFQILHGDFVDTSAGTGIVHLAPSFGEDDFNTCAQAGIGSFNPLSLDGRFTEEVPLFAGLDVFEANPRIIEVLKKNNLLFHRDQYRHSYPHCWRCDTPLIYRTIDSWYVAVTQFRDQMVQNNKEIFWVPYHIREGRFGQWLAGARDWCISRNRFWGTPLPVWKCTKCANMYVPSSLSDLESQYGKPVTDLHRPECDLIAWTCNHDGCDGEMHRIQEVLDCWFESGGMPYAQVHYPFENKDWFNENFPADFIVEYISQTRGWFYTLMVESTALMGGPPFKNAICHGVMLAEDGRKLSKRLRNFPDPIDVVNNYGSDALRICLLASPVVRGEDIRFSEKGVHEAMRRYILPLWNVAHFFTSYAELVPGYEPKLLNTGENEGDRYILSELEIFRKSMMDAVEAYNLPACYRHLLAFVETLSGWYLRNNRNRFWVTEISEDAEQAFNTLYTVLYELCLIAAPFLPFTAEYLYRHFTGKSVHLEDWPEEKQERLDEELVNDTVLARSLIETIRKIREKNRMKLRQPLPFVRVSVLSEAMLNRYSDLIKTQGNLKEIKAYKTAAEFAAPSMTLVRKTAGPFLKSGYTKVAQALEKGEYEKLANGNLVCAGFELDKNMYTTEWKAHNESEEVMPVSGRQEVVVSLSLSISDALRREGLAREINRMLQDLRKQEQFAYDTRIDLYLSASGEWEKAFEEHKEWLLGQLLGVDVFTDVSEARIEIKDEAGELRAMISPHK